MHTSGKVLAWLVVIAGLAASFFTAKLIQTRNSFTAKWMKVSTDYESREPQLVSAKAELGRLQEELLRAGTNWGATIDMVPTQVAGPEGRLQVSMGRLQGLRESMLLYGFEIQPDGSAIYRGDFTVSQVQDQQALLVPASRIRQQELATWKAGATNWRWRTMIPETTTKLFSDMELALVRADELLASRQQSVQIQDQLIAQAQEQRAQRVAELIGGNELPKDPQLSTEFREGLVAGLEEAEEQRNAALIRIDELRRNLQNLQNRVEGLLRDNSAKAGELPQSSPSEETQVTQKPRI